MIRYLKIGDVFSIDKSKILFVVTEASMGGGGTGHGPNDIYPDGWQISSRQLNKDRTYSPKGRRKNFSQSGCFNNRVLPERITLDGTMKKQVEFIWS